MSYRYVVLVDNILHLHTLNSVNIGATKLAMTAGRPVKKGSKNVVEDAMFFQ